MSTIKVFISQPMKDKTDEQILAERNYAIKEIKKQYGNDKINAEELAPNLAAAIMNRKD